MISVTPGDPVPVFNENNPRVILVIRFYHLRITTFHGYRFMIYFPMNTIFAKPCKNIHLHCLVITSEHTRKSIAKRDNCTVKNTVGRRYSIPFNNWVHGIPPHDFRIIFRSFFPWNIFCKHIVLNLLNDVFNT